MLMLMVHTSLPSIPRILLPSMTRRLSTSAVAALVSAGEFTEYHFDPGSKSYARAHGGDWRGVRVVCVDVLVDILVSVCWWMVTDGFSELEDVREEGGYIGVLRVYEEGV